MAHEKQLKWERRDKCRAKRPQSRAILASFGGLLWPAQMVPNSHNLPTCPGVEGTSGVAGCVRFCTGFKTTVDQRSDRNQDQEKANWTKRKLLGTDPATMTFSYSIIYGNVRFNSYISSVEVVRKDAGWTIVWKYEVEPVEGWRLEDLDLFIGAGLEVMASRMEASLHNPEIKPGNKSVKVDKLSDL